MKQRKVSLLLAIVLMAIPLLKAVEGQKEALGSWPQQTNYLSSCGGLFCPGDCESFWVAAIVCEPTGDPNDDCTPYEAQWATTDECHIVWDWFNTHCECNPPNPAG